jgi:hypothetical protein
VPYLAKKEGKMKYWFDTEFFERANDHGGGSIDLISIGIISEDNRELYLECSDFDWGDESLDPWLEDNVKPHLQTKGVPCGVIREAILSFVDGDERPEFWAYFAAYDWVVFCWIFGRMVDLPRKFPKYCRDFKQVMDMIGIKRKDLPRKPKNAHHALADAKWLKEAYEKAIASLD